MYLELLLRRRRGSVRELDVDLQPLHLIRRILVGADGHGVGYLAKERTYRPDLRSSADYSSTFSREQTQT